MYKILHIPTALYAESLWGDSSFETETEAQHALTTSDSWTKSEDLILLWTFTSGYRVLGNNINYKEFEIVEVPDV